MNWEKFKFHKNRHTIAWLMIPWLLVSSSHQQTWYWTCWINGSSPRKDFNLVLTMTEKHKYFLMFNETNFATQGSSNWILVNDVQCLPNQSHNNVFRSLWPSDVIWQHRSGSTVAQVMACFLGQHCFNGLGKDIYKTRRAAFKFWDLVLLILEVWQYITLQWEKIIVWCTIWA